MHTKACNATRYSVITLFAVPFDEKLWSRVHSRRLVKRSFVVALLFCDRAGKRSRDRAVSKSIRNNYIL